MAGTTPEPRRLRLITNKGAIIQPVGPGGSAANGENKQRLSEEQGEEELITLLSQLHRRLDPADDLSLRVSILLAEAQHRQAQRRP